MKTKKPNAWGIYDMHGNLWEWVQDWYGTYPKEKVIDPIGPDSASARVFRGGGFSNGASDVRSASRFLGLPSFPSGNVGFRLCSSP